jgi:hypothetical protein
MFIEEPSNNKLWHIPFNWVNDELIVNMVDSNADAYTATSSPSRAAGRHCPGCRI